MKAVYAAGVDPYLEAGYTDLIPLPQGRKFPPEEGFTGADGRTPTAEDIARWKISKAAGNLALRPPDNLVGFDVDQYDDKTGADTLDALEASWGPLPATWISTARPLPSGIRLFRVPAGTVLNGEAGDFIEIIQRRHRYVCVAVAVPRMRGDLIEIDAVFSSAAGAAWTLTRTGQFRSVSIYAHCQEFHRGTNGRLVKGVLTSVDLCESGKDDLAKVTTVVAATDLTPAQREVQRRFDQYLASDSPVAYDFIARADREGAAALEPLRPVVAPLIGPWTEPTPVRKAPTPGAGSVTRSKALPCGASLDGFTCDKPRGHDGMHFSDRPPARSDSSCMGWDDRARSGDRERLRLSVA